MLKELAAIVVCPECGGTGKEYSLMHHTLVVCSVCWGKKYMPSATCLGCGRPAIKLWPPKQRPIIQYCGLEACFSALVTIHRPAGYKTTPLIVQVAMQEDLDRAERRRGEEYAAMREVLGSGFRLNERL